MTNSNHISDAESFARHCLCHGPVYTLLTETNTGCIEECIWTRTIIAHRVACNERADIESLLLVGLKSLHSQGFAKRNVTVNAYDCSQYILCWQWAGAHDEPRTK
jgi:hypothetical protein